MAFVKFCWIITALATVVASIELFFTMTVAQSAPQQAGGAAMAAGIAIIPYVFTRCMEGLATSYPLQVRVAAPVAAKA
jgi:hypothetical protein